MKGYEGKFYSASKHDLTQCDKRIFIINKMKCKGSN